MLLNNEGKFVEDPKLKRILARAVCGLPKLLGGGHKRGKRLSTNAVDGYASYQCPRCGSTWLRKVKA